MKPSVSIIVPVYNVEKFLDRCIKSILNQTYKEYELILVDDGSPDNCPQICDEYARQYEHIKVVHKENGGLSSARLAGFDIAQGEYVLFVDSDDFIHKCMIEKMVSAIKEENADMTMCGYNTVCAGKVEAIPLIYDAKTIEGREKILSDYVFPLIGDDTTGINIPGFLCIRLCKRSLIRREFFKSEREYFLEDHVFDLYYVDSVERIAIVNEPLYYYCINRKSLSNCYRKEKWKMYLTLYQFYLEYMKERNLADEKKRLNNFLMGALFAVVDNAVLSGNYNSYINELKLMIDDLHAKKAIKEFSVKSLTWMQKLILSLLKMHMYRLIYYIRRQRLQKLYSE